MLGELLRGRVERPSFVGADVAAAFDAILGEPGRERADVIDARRGLVRRPLVVGHNASLGCWRISAASVGNAFVRLAWRTAKSGNGHSPDGLGRVVRSVPMTMSSKPRPPVLAMPLWCYSMGPLTPASIELPRPSSARYAVPAHDGDGGRCRIELTGEGAEPDVGFLLVLVVDA